MSKFTKGERYRAGNLANGTVVGVDALGRASIEWDETFRGTTGEWGTHEIGRHLVLIRPAEPAPPPVPEHECTRSACRKAYAHDGLCSDGGSSYAAQQSTQQGLGGEPPGDWVSRKEHVVLKGELAAAQKSAEILRNERVMMHGTAADLKGERDRLKLRVAELETDCAWLRKENVRLGGKARGSR